MFLCVFLVYIIFCEIHTYKSIHLEFINFSPLANHQTYTASLRWLWNLESKGHVFYISAFKRVVTASALSLVAVFKTSQLKQRRVEERYWFRMWNSHTGSHASYLFPSWGMIFGVMRPLRSRSSLEEVGHWGNIVGYTPASPSAFLLLIECK